VENGAAARRFPSHLPVQGPASLGNRFHPGGCRYRWLLRQAIPLLIPDKSVPDAASNHPVYHVMMSSRFAAGGVSHDSHSAANRAIHDSSPAVGKKKAYGSYNAADKAVRDKSLAAARECPHNHPGHKAAADILPVPGKEALDIHPVCKAGVDMVRQDIRHRIREYL